MQTTNLEALIEPEAAGKTSTQQSTALLSIAISLKRIADWLEGSGPGFFADRITDAISAGIIHSSQNLKK